MEEYRTGEYDARVIVTTLGVQQHTGVNSFMEVEGDTGMIRPQCRPAKGEV